MKKFTFIWLVLLMTTNFSAQIKKITGTVTDFDGAPFPGVTVAVEKTNVAVLTNFEGYYEIEGLDNQKLVFSFIGRKTVKIPIGSSNVINVQLEDDTQYLEEVVVTAQGIRREKKALGYAVSSVGSHQLSKRKNRKAARALSGKVSGVQITSAGGASGSATNVKIRGYSSFNASNKALFIVDGVPIDTRSNNVLSQINPEDINKVEVLNGLAAATLYGKQGQGGVILVSTKKGDFKINSSENVIVNPFENNEHYEAITENSFERVALNPLSTFAIDVDKAGYSNVRRFINRGQKVPVDAVKIEEMVNYFDYEYQQPNGEHPFSIHTEAALTPWNSKTKLVRIGLQGKTYENEELPASNLTFLIDVSGSMNSPNKLPLLKSAFRLLVNQLREKDKVSIVVYAGAAGVVLKPTRGSNKEKILNALNNLSAGGSTAGGEGIELAYKLAAENYKENGNNRVILATDGDFNVGASSNKAMEKLIEEKRKSGVFLSVLGFGMGNYQDSKLETLADKGNGNHAYIDTMQEAQKVFGKEFGGTLYTIAKDVKIQVEFNPSQIQAYRLIGYENRLLEDEDFIDDTKDAGELGSGHKVTALYEVIPVGVESAYIKDNLDLKYTKSTVNTELSDELLTVKFRYKKPKGTKSIEMVEVMKNTASEMSSDFKFAAAVALYGMHLKNSNYINETKLKDVISLAEKGKGKDHNGYRSEFIRLVSATESLP